MDARIRLQVVCLRIQGRRDGNSAHGRYIFDYVLQLHASNGMDVAVAQIVLTHKGLKNPLAGKLSGGVRAGLQLGKLLSL